METKLQDSYTKRRNNQEREALKKIKADPKAFFAYAKKFSKLKTEVGPLLSEEGNLVSDDDAIAKVLKKAIWKCV